VHQGNPSMVPCPHGRGVPSRRKNCGNAQPINAREPWPPTGWRCRGSLPARSPGCVDRSSWPGSSAAADQGDARHERRHRTPRRRCRRR